MTVNANVRCVEWFDTEHVTPIGYRHVIGWYFDGIPRTVIFNGNEWILASRGPGQLRDEFAKPSHWCEWPDGPELRANQGINRG